MGQQDIVIKALGKSLKKVRGFAGATELGDQRVGLVLDAAALIAEVLERSPVISEARAPQLGHAESRTGESMAARGVALKEGGLA